MTFLFVCVCVCVCVCVYVCVCVWPGRCACRIPRSPQPFSSIPLICRSCNQDFTRRVREFLYNCEQVHGKAPPPVSTDVVAGPKAFIDQCELLSRCRAVCWMLYPSMFALSDWLQCLGWG